MDGTGNAALLLESETTAPPAGAAVLSCTVTTENAADESPTPLPDEICTDVRVGRTSGAMVTVAVCEEPASDAVTVAVVVAFTEAD